MKLEDLLQPVKTGDEWGYADQYKKLVEENQEVGAELKKYYDIQERRIVGGDTSTQSFLDEYCTLRSAAIEAGDVIIAAAKFIDMSGFRLATILEACYEKNKARGYYNNGVGK